MYSLLVIYQSHCPYTYISYLLYPYASFRASLPLRSMWLFWHSVPVLVTGHLPFAASNTVPNMGWLGQARDWKTVKHMQTSTQKSRDGLSVGEGTAPRSSGTLLYVVKQECMVISAEPWTLGLVYIWQAGLANLNRNTLCGEQSLDHKSLSGESMVDSFCIHTLSISTQRPEEGFATLLTLLQWAAFASFLCVWSFGPWHDWCRSTICLHSRIYTL